MRWADPKPHERIAVVGIGGLGHLALQYSKAAGFETIAITHSKDKEELARKLGADFVVSDGQGLREAGGADIILATSNSYKAATDTLRGLRPSSNSRIGKQLESYKERHVTLLENFYDLIVAIIVCRS